MSFVKGRFQANAEVIWTIPAPPELDLSGQILYDPITQAPLPSTLVAATERSALAWFEMNVNNTPLNAVTWNEDGSSEYLKVNLIGRFVGPSPLERTWPEGLPTQDTVKLKIWLSQTHVFEAPAYVFPRGTTALKRPTRRFGDAIRVQLRVKQNEYFDVATYFGGGL